MSRFLLILLIYLVNTIDKYEELINEKVTEEYCNEVISNIIGIINEGYVYSDFLKAPQTSKYGGSYDKQVDLIKELNNINKKDRYFYDFYREIQEIMSNTQDGHFSITTERTPKIDKFQNYYLCIPFFYEIKEVIENDEVKDAYFTIKLRNPGEYSCYNNYTQKDLDYFSSLEGMKISKINDLSPAEYIEQMALKYYAIHSPQARYVDMMDYIDFLGLQYYPFKKDELKVKIEFENSTDILETNYQFFELTFDTPEFEEFFEQEKRKYFLRKINLPRIEQIKLKYQKKKGLIQNQDKKNKLWDLVNDEESIKCYVDEKNKINVLYQNSFIADDFYNYEEIMINCIYKFYDNDYKIVIIEDKNPGGYVDLCVPLTNYMRPRILRHPTMSRKSTNLNLEHFFMYNQHLNPDTCHPYTEKDNFLDGIKDVYSDEVTHRRTKNYFQTDLFLYKRTERLRNNILNIGYIRKPTEIIVFTDGYSFSCASDFIKGLQKYGSAIIVGYNPRPDLADTKFDSSQSSSGIETFDFQENIQNLANLGYTSGITYDEEYSPYDKNSPQIPEEFLIYPVDEVSKIYQKYDDSIYDRFINEAQRIFNKYNDLENGECNPDNKILYYETEECDSKLNIEKAHGGYLCGADGKWDKNTCIASYCDEGYFLDKEKNECIADPCEDIQMETYEIKDQEEIKLNLKLDSNTFYYFYSSNLVDKYTFEYNTKDVICMYDSYGLYVVNDTKIVFDSLDEIYVNFYLNSTEDVDILIKKIKDETPNKNNYKLYLIPLFIIVTLIVAILKSTHSI